MERTTEREGEEAKEMQERDRQGEEKGICAKNNDGPIQRLYIAGTRITGLNQFATHIHTVLRLSHSSPGGADSLNTHTHVHDVIHLLRTDPTSRRGSCELRGCEDLRFQADSQQTERATGRQTERYSVTDGVINRQIKKKDRQAGGKAGGPAGQGRVCGLLVGEAALHVARRNAK